MNHPKSLMDAMDTIEACYAMASRVNFESTHRRELRKWLCAHDLEVARWLIELRALALEPESEVSIPL